MQVARLVKRARVKPRNPLTVAAKRRAAGPHGPSTKALRQRAKRQLKKLLEGK